MLSSRAKSRSQPVSLPGAQPLMKPLTPFFKSVMHKTSSVVLVILRTRNSAHVDTEKYETLFILQ